MRLLVSLVLSFCATAATACLQQLDTTASSGSPVSPPVITSDGGLSTVILSGPPPFGFYDPSGNIITSDQPCDATRAQATAILTKNCADCHGGRTPGERAGNPPFDFVLDPVKLTRTYTPNTTPPMLFVVPGDPDHSRLYVRARLGEMPPAAQMNLSRPTVSDISVLHEWISNCLGAKPPPPGGGSNDAGARGAADGGRD
jgi:mono/diheme cytochrome c family protein